MAIIHRLSRLFTADVHAVLDRIEDPEVLLQQAIREMEEDVARSEQRRRALEHERDLLAERQRKLQATLTDLAAQLDVCFADRNDELARKVIKRRLETERLDRHVAERRVALDTKLAAEHRAIAERREQLDGMREKAELLVATPAAADDLGSCRAGVSDDDVEVALLRERQRRQPS